MLMFNLTDQVREQIQHTMYKRWCGALTALGLDTGQPEPRRRARCRREPGELAALEELPLVHARPVDRRRPADGVVEVEEGGARAVAGDGERGLLGCLFGVPVRRADVVQHTDGRPDHQRQRCVHRRDHHPARRRPAGLADRLVAAGVTSILNFAPTVLSVPEGVDVRKVDLSIELQILAFHEQRKAGEDAPPEGDDPEAPPMRATPASRKGPDGDMPA
ncbi:Redox-sensing transcriptional repressor Rex [Streptomyces microflavus]